MELSQSLKGVDKIDRSGLRDEFGRISTNLDLRIYPQSATVPRPDLNIGVQ